MLSIEPILNHVGPFMMVLFRLSGLFVFAPLLGSSIIPIRVRALFVFMLALALYPTLPPDQQAPIRLDLFALAPAVFAETLIGLAIGLVAALPMFAAQLGGLVMGQQAGITLGQVFNPTLDIEADVFGQLLQYVGIVVFAAMGGLEVLFLAVAGTFASVPIGHASIQGGGAAGWGATDMLVGVVGSGFELALRVAAPVLCIVLIETVASSVIMKTIPQINIQSIGFATKVIAAFLALIAGVAAIHQAVREETHRTTAQVVRWVAELPPPSTPASREP